MNDPTVQTVIWAATGLAIIVLGVIVAPYTWRRFSTWLDKRVTNILDTRYEAMNHEHDKAIDAELQDMVNGH